MTIRIVLLVTVAALGLVQMAGCTLVMCHPYKLVGLCEYVGSDGLEKPR